MNLTELICLFVRHQIMVMLSLLSQICWRLSNPAGRRHVHRSKRPGDFRQESLPQLCVAHELVIRLWPDQRCGGVHCPAEAAGESRRADINEGAERQLAGSEGALAGVPEAARALPKSSNGQ
jgi:hypothetical protein